MLRVATWAAVSSEAQNTEDKVSIPDQQLAARRKAKELGAVVIDELVVPGCVNFSWLSSCQIEASLLV